MAQIFHPSTNAFSKVSIIAAFIVIILGASTWGLMLRSSYVTNVGVPVEQTVPFSHKHHVKGLGIDCLFCHTSVEDSAFAGIPPTHTCMTCHSQVWSETGMLEPVRESYRTDESMEWNRVHDLPDFAYFNHSIHVAKGIGCTTCHGEIDEMPLVWKANTLQMEWCLDCHRNPERYVRPKDMVFDVDWTPPADQVSRGRKLVEEYGIEPGEKLTNCSICHR